MATRSMPFWPRPATTSGSSWPGSGLCAPFSGRLSWSGITRAAPHPPERPSSLFHRRPAIAEELNRLLADTFALYLKTKNFHWHVSGPHFRDYHVLLDEQSAQILATTDDMAERVRKIGATTLRSIGHIARL